VGAVSNRGDYRIIEGESGGDDLSRGILLTSVRELSVDHGHGEGVQYGISSVDTSGGGYFASLFTAPDGSEFNADLAAVYFPFSEGWLAGRAFGSGNGAPFTSLVATPSAGIELNPSAGGFGLTDLGGGQSKLMLNGVDSRTDGLLLVNGGKNEDNYALSRVDQDGGWTLFVHDTGAEFNAHEQDPVNFVFVPNRLTGMVTGRVNGLGNVVMQNGAFHLDTYNHTIGRHRLTIPGHSPETGALIVSPEGGSGNNDDNIITYGSNGDGWVIQVLDIPGDFNQGMQPQGVGDSVSFSFAFFPFAGVPTAVDDVIERYEGTGAVKISVGDLLENDSDSEAVSPTFGGLHGATSRNGRALNVIASRWIVYEPGMENETPDDQFEYWIVDRDGNRSSATVTIREINDHRQTSNLRKQILRNGGAEVELDFRGIPGRRYQLQYTDHMDGSNTVWTDMDSPSTTGSRGRVQKTDAIVEGRNRFYRLIEVRTDP
jgi:hypothetical protein